MYKVSVKEKKTHEVRGIKRGDWMLIKVHLNFPPKAN